MKKAGRSVSLKSLGSQRERRLVWLFYILAVYVLLQFMWWAWLLIDLNKKHFAPEGEDTVRLKVLMVAGEGAVFLIFLLAGIYIMQRTVRKEFALVRQQRNFLLSVTHELKTPVAAIKLCLQTLQKHSGLAPEKRISLESVAVENTERLHNLIDNVLLATRIESGRGTLNTEPTDLSAMTSRLCENVRSATAGPVEIRTAIESGISADTDPQAFASIFLNLTENAAKYAKNAPIEIDLKKTSDGRIKLRVADGGPGIPPAERKRVFEKFYRMGNEETRTGKGTGLGLYIVKYYADLLGAEITVDDNVPRGAVFTVVLK